MQLDTRAARAVLELLQLVNGDFRVGLQAGDAAVVKAQLHPRFVAGAGEYDGNKVDLEFGRLPLCRFELHLNIAL